MAILENRVKTTNSLLDFPRFIRKYINHIFATAVICFSINLLSFAVPQRVSSGVLEITGNLISGAYVIYNNIVNITQKIDQNLAYFHNLQAENTALKLEVARLNKLQRERDILQKENTDLKRIANVASSPQYEFITAKLLSISSTPFGHTAIIAAGSESGAQIDQIVVNDDYLVGRIIEVSDHYAKIMLITDANARIPVVGTTSGVRAVMAGDNEVSKLIYLEDTFLISPQEEFLTSGDGKIYPQGIRVGYVSKITKDEVLIKPTIDLTRTNFVQIVKPKSVIPDPKLN